MIRRLELVRIHAGRCRRLEADYQQLAEELPKTLTTTERAAIQALASNPCPGLDTSPPRRLTARADPVLIKDIAVAAPGRRVGRRRRRLEAAGSQATGWAIPTSPAGPACRTTCSARVTLAEGHRLVQQIADVLDAEGIRRPGGHRSPAGQVRTLITAPASTGRARPAAVLTGLAPGRWHRPPVRRARHAHSQHLQLDLPPDRIAASTPRDQNSIITANDDAIQRLPQHGAHQTSTPMPLVPTPHRTPQQREDAAVGGAACLDQCQRSPT